MTHYVTSTHTNSTRYVEWDKNCNKNHNVIKKAITIKGGHGISNKHFITPEGVVTVINNDAEMDWLMTVDAFKRDIEKGYIRVMKRKEESEKTVRRDMNPKDGSAPNTPNDYIKVEGQENTYRATGTHNIL